jgi:hypothetical protein
MSRVKASKKLATFLFKFNPRGGPIEPHFMKQTGILSKEIPEIVQYQHERTPLRDQIL